MQLKDLSSAYQALASVIENNQTHNWYRDTLAKNLFKSMNKSQSYTRFVSQGIPMPESQNFRSLEELSVLVRRSFPFVVKFDTKSLIGTQTIVVKNTSDLQDVFEESKNLNCSSGIVQEFVAGREYTITVLVGKNNWISLGVAQDYKKRYENNTGPNTFGLGSISPVPSNPIADQLIDKIILALPGYQGLLSCQFIETDTNLYFLEYETRLCDPEFQSMFELVDFDLNRALVQCKEGQHIDPIRPKSINAVTVALIHRDWPNPRTEMEPLNLEHSKFRIWTNRGSYTKNLYWGSITNSGPEDHVGLAKEIYNWLDSLELSPYKYRTDIGS